MVRHRHRGHDGLVSSLGVLDDQVATQSAIRFRGFESDSGHGCIRRFLEGRDRDKGMDRVGLNRYRDRISRVVLARTNRFRTIAAENMSTHGQSGGLGAKLPASPWVETF
jgi:hypothetical protein